MSAGLFGLLDDVAAIAKMAAASVDDVGAAVGKATVKAAGVVVDDTAVTPQYVRGITAERELPIIRKIARGSIRNKLVFILPGALLLGKFLPGLLPIILIFGGSFLAYEGAHKVWAALTGHDHHEAPAVELGPEAEREMVRGAIRTDLILSAEIMIIALDSVADESFWTRMIVLIVVAFVITIAVYGVVALIVKMDDAGLLLARRPSALAQKVGRALVNAMPRLLEVISVVGTAAMLWVGGHIMLVNLDKAGWWHWPYHVVHGWEHHVAHALHRIGGLAGWLTNTGASAVVGLFVGGLVLAVTTVLPVPWQHDPLEPAETD